MTTRSPSPQALVRNSLAHFLVVLCVVLLRTTAPASAGGEQKWQPEEWADGSTLEIITTDPVEGEARSTVWYVVIQSDVYVRLSTDAAEQLERNIKRPYVMVRIGGQTFSDVRADPANDSSVSVNDALAEKYPLDILFRYLPHPLIVRLRAASF